MQDIEKIIRAWKDEDYRNSLNAAEQLALPDNPAGKSEFGKEDLIGPAQFTYTPSLFLFFGVCF